MGIDIHAYVECDFQNETPPFSAPESIRCINTGEFFIWRCPELFHALGLDRWDLGLPPSPIVLGRVPKYFSRTVIDGQCLIVSPYVAEKTKTDRLIKFPRSVLLEWPKEHLLYFPLVNDQYYNVDLKKGEILLFDPGCELPNFLHAKEIESAIAACGIHGEKVDYFLGIVAMMNRLGERLSPKHVRLFYWFDSVGPNFQCEYKMRNSIENEWPNPWGAG